MDNFEQNISDEEVINEGLGIFVKSKTLYHGSSVAGIEKLHTAEETTIGNGIYFTSQKDVAQGYASRRSQFREGNGPIVYKVEIENLKFTDLRNNDNVQHILNGILPILIEQRNEEGLTWMKEIVLDQAIEKIKEKKIGAGNLRDVTQSIGKIFTEYIRSLGYDGIIAIEGGEGEDMGNHDTYLVFYSDKLKGLSVQ
jgi:hypothetical protein